MLSQKHDALVCCRYPLKSLMRHLFGAFSNYIWRCLNVIKICAGWTVWAQITASKWLEKHRGSASVLITTCFNTWAWAVACIFICHTSRLVGFKVGVREKQMKALFPRKFTKTRAEVEEKRGEKNKRVRDGWKWSGAWVLWECLCAALAKKNKALASLGSDFSMEAWQETGSSGVGWGGGRLLLMFSHRREKNRCSTRTIVLFTYRPTGYDGGRPVSICVGGIF